MTYIVIPTYNEAENVTELVSKIRRYLKDAYLLFVDDNSTDQTRDIVEKLQLKDNRIKLLKRPKKNGLGSAYRDGFKQALQDGARTIIQMDADLSHQPKYLPSFLKELENNNLVIGSRYITDGGIKKWNILRKLISRSASIYSRLVLDLPLKDLTGGYKAWKAPALRQVLDQGSSSNGYIFQVEMNYIAHRLGFAIKEIPIVFIDRVHGTSKMDYRIAKEAITKVWDLRFKH